MNSYFASVEQQANPFLRGKPVGICAYLSSTFQNTPQFTTRVNSMADSRNSESHRKVLDLSKNGCIIASSIEAKSLGIKTGCRVQEAKKLCPEVILIENNPDKYRTVTKKIFAILQEYTDVFEPYSIDEAFLDLTGWAKDFFQAHQLALTIQVRIKREVGDWLKMSIGLAFTRFLAKLCSDSAGDDEIKILKSSQELNDLYRSLNLTDVWGINKRLEIRLNRLGIFNLIDLKNYPVTNLMQAFGKVGYFLWANINGVEINGLQKAMESKSIGHSYCLPRQTMDKGYLSAILLKLSSKVGNQLLESQRQAKGWYVGWRCLNEQPFHKTGKSADFIKSGDALFIQVNKLLQQASLVNKVVFLAVGVFNFSPYFNQLSLFSNRKRGQEINCLVKKINDRFGNELIYPGKLWGLKNQAVDRIGFRKVPLD